jgi:Flp pilus assembly pilin Flp
MLKKLFRDEEGQDLIEYALLAGFITVLSIAAIKLIGPVIQGIFEDIHAALTS